MNSERRSQNSELRKEAHPGETAELEIEVEQQSELSNIRKNPPRDIHERTFEFACRIVRFYLACERRKGVPKSLLTQLLNSGTSIGANLQEGKAAQSRADFISKARIALKEARESHYWLKLFENVQLVPSRLIHPLVEEAHAIVSILTTIVKRTTTRKTT